MTIVPIYLQARSKKCFHHQFGIWSVVITTTVFMTKSYTYPTVNIFHHRFLPHCAPQPFEPVVKIITASSYKTDGENVFYSSECSTNYPWKINLYLQRVVRLLDPSSLFTKDGPLSQPHGRYHGINITILIKKEEKQSYCATTQVSTQYTHIFLNIIIAIWKSGLKI